MAADITLPAAAAGLLSSLSQWVLPLGPTSLADLAGVTMKDLEIETRSEERRDALLSARLFVLDFSTVFVSLGATANVIGSLIRANLHILPWAAGTIIILMGPNFLGVLRV